MEHCTRRPDNRPEKRKYYPDDNLAPRDVTDYNYGPKRHNYGRNFEENRNFDRNNAQSFHGNNNNFQAPAPYERERFAPPEQAAFATSISNANMMDFVDRDRRSFVDQQPTTSTMSSYSLPSNVNTHTHIPSMNNTGPALASGSATPFTGSTHTPIVPNLMALITDMSQNKDAGIDPFAGMNTGITNMFEIDKYGSYPTLNGQNLGAVAKPVKDIVNLSKCVLYPPKVDSQPPTTLDVPAGCKAVFVRGMPVKVTEKIVQEVFERCGEIRDIRMKKRMNHASCNIQFTTETAVKNAVHLSGHTIKVENKEDKLHSGVLIVSHSNFRDQYKYECEQREKEREARHRDRKLASKEVVFTLSEANHICSKLREEKTFLDALSVLTCWLKKGECNKRTSATFYSLIQSTNCNVRRLMMEKQKYEDELNKAKMIMNENMSKILNQFHEILDLFAIVSLPKAWDHFTKTQRKNIEMWKKQAEEIRSSYTEELLNDRIEDDMDLCQDEETEEKIEVSPKEDRSSNNEQKTKLNEEINQLKEQNGTLKRQLEAAENETLVLKSESNQELGNKNQEIETLKQTLDNTNKEVTKLNEELSANKEEVEALRALNIAQDEKETKSKRSSASFNQREARLFGLIYSFLNIHPFGAYIYEIWTYVSKVYSNMQPKDLESFLKKFPSIFRKEREDNDSDSSMKWKVLSIQR